MNSEVNYVERYASHPTDAKGYDTQRLRSEYLIENLMVPSQINITISSYDRLIVGGAIPVDTPLKLVAVDPLKAPFFLHRREAGIVNVGGAGVVECASGRYELDYKEALYLGKLDSDIMFTSCDPKNPAMFYINSAPAHCEYPNRKVSKEDAIKVELGDMGNANHRVINKLIVRELFPTCQLQMGMTELKTGSVWNTMPAHTHSRRMEAYFYFELPENEAVCHFMGEPDETRHIWMKNNQAVISPQWSIHSACATHNYTFIWGMAGENLDYGDQDFYEVTDLK